MSKEVRKLFQYEWKDLRTLGRVLVTRSAAQPVDLESVPFLTDGVQELSVAIRSEPSWRMAVQGREGARTNRLVREHLSKVPGAFCAMSEDDQESMARYDRLKEARRDHCNWALSDSENVKCAISDAAMTEGMRHHLDNYFGLDLDKALLGLYMTGLDKAWFHTHLLAVWLRGGILVGWEGEFPEGRIIGHFFGKEPGPWP